MWDCTHIASGKSKPRVLSCLNFARRPSLCDDCRCGPGHLWLQVDLSWNMSRNIRSSWVGLEWAWNLYAVAGNRALMNGCAVKINLCWSFLQWRMCWMISRNLQTASAKEGKAVFSQFPSVRQQTQISSFSSPVLPSFFRDHCFSSRLTGPGFYLNITCHSLKTSAGMAMEYKSPCYDFYFCHCFERPGDLAEGAFCSAPYSRGILRRKLLFFQLGYHLYE